MFQALGLTLKSIILFSLHKSLTRNILLLQVRKPILQVMKQMRISTLSFSKWQNTGFYFSISLEPMLYIIIINLKEN